MTDTERLAKILAKMKRGKTLTAAEQAFADTAQRPPEYYATLQEIADQYGVSVDALRRWKKVAPDAFKAGPNGYSADRIADARKAFIAQGSKVRLCKGDEMPSNGSPADNLPLSPASTWDEIKKYKGRLECQKLATQCDQQNKLLVRRELVIRGYKTVCYGVRDAFCRVAKETGPRVSGQPPTEATEIIDERINAILNKMETTDFEQFERFIDNEEGAPVKATRLPAARITNGREKAS